MEAACTPFDWPRVGAHRAGKGPGRIHRAGTGPGHIHRRRSAATGAPR